VKILFTFATKQATLIRRSTKLNQESLAEGKGSIQLTSLY
jgi:hypothetical protein